MANTIKPLKIMINIQDKQFELDKLKKDRAVLNKEIKSLQFEIPNLIRNLGLR